MHRLGVLIAAAGNSARMGSPKALMPIAQRTAIDFATHQFSKILHLDIYVSLPPALLVLDAPLQRDAQRRSPHSLPIYPRLDRGVRAHCAISSTKPWCKPRDQTAGRTVRLINRFSDQGYLGSIKSMLEDHAGNLDGLFITPIDSPPFDERLIIVMAQLARVDHEPRIIVPHAPISPGHPVYLSRHFFSRLLHYDGASGLRGFIRRHHSHRVTLSWPDDRILVNINNRSDLAHTASNTNFRNF